MKKHSIWDSNCGGRLLGVLRNAGIEYWEDLAQMTDREFKKLPNTGAETLKEAQACLRALKLDFIHEYVLRDRDIEVILNELIEKQHLTTIGKRIFLLQLSRVQKERWEW